MSVVSETTIDFLTGILTSTRPLGAWLLDEKNAAGLGEFEELCWQYLHKLPGQLKLGRINTRIEADAANPGHFRYEFDSRLFLSEGDQPEPVGQMMVTLYRKPGSVDNDIYLELDQCQLWYPHMRGKGIGRALVERVIQLGQALGVKALTAIAIYDGRFVWPALGFRFGDYLPDQAAARKFQIRFEKFCQRHQITPPTDLSRWDAPDFAHFLTGVKLKIGVGHSMDRQQVFVGFGRAFLLSRRPFFLSYPL